MKHFIKLVFVLFTINSYSQISILTDLNSDYYQLRVKTPDEFMQRFNYEQTPRGKTIKYSDSLKQERVKYIQTLFDMDLLEKAQKNDTLKNTIIDFIKQVAIDSTYFLNYYSKKWYAEVNCSVKYKNKKQNITLFLKPEINKKQVSKWVIYDCYGEIFNLKPKDSTYKIGPANHNLDFMEILKMNKFYNKSVANLTYNNHKIDRLSIFIFLMYNKELEITNIRNISYHFKQISGYYFVVKDIQRSSSNSGWLITDIKDY